MRGGGAESAERDVHALAARCAELAAENEALRARKLLLDEATALAQVGGWMFDARTGAGVWTEEVARIHDVEPDAPISRDAGLDFYTEHSRPVIAAAVRDAVERALPYDVELEIVSAKGVRKWVRTMGHPVVEDGRVVRVVGSLQDITSRKRAEDALAAEVTRRRILIEGSQDGIVVLNRDGGVFEANRRFAEMLGYSEAEVRQLHVWDWDCDWSRERVLASIRDVGVEGAHFETRHRCKDGSVHDVELSSNGAEMGGQKLVFCVCRDITARKATEAALREGEERLRLFIEHAPAALAMFDTQMRYLAASRRWISDYGISEQDLLGRSHYEVFPEITETWKAHHRRGFSGEVVRENEDRFVRADGSFQYLRWELRPWRHSDGSIGGIVIFTEDITVAKRSENERASLEAQLLQSQKMESIGRLAGGVAHDFNNLLGVVIGHAELALSELGTGHRVAPELQGILEASGRAAKLTAQLLGFARKQAINPRLVNLNAAVQDTLTMLGRIIGEHIRLGWSPAAKAATVYIDPSQLDQVLTNLAVNARDAINGQGRITIATAEVALAEGACDGAAAGEYVTLSVSDSGCGMDQETCKRIFEPFFTTKAEGKGTGLGLSTVYGIVRQNLGFVTVESAPGRGTTITVGLPRREGCAEGEAGAAPAALRPAFGKETVLLVEDNEALLSATARLLQRAGYEVLPASSAAEAETVGLDRAARIDVLLTDLVMPGMNGLALAERLMQARPGLACVLMSGYSAGSAGGDGTLPEGYAFLQKPFTGRALAGKLREVLDAAAAAHS